MYCRMRDKQANKQTTATYRYMYMQLSLQVCSTQISRHILLYMDNRGIVLFLLCAFHSTHKSCTLFQITKQCCAAQVTVNQQLTNSKHQNQLCCMSQMRRNQFQSFNFDGQQDMTQVQMRSHCCVSKLQFNNLVIKNNI